MSNVLLLLKLCYPFIEKHENPRNTKTQYSDELSSVSSVYGNCELQLFLCSSSKNYYVKCISAIYALQNGVEMHRFHWP